MFPSNFIEFSSRIRRLGRCVPVVLLALFSGLIRADGLAELDDAAARLQYAYYSADVRAVRAGIESIDRLSIPASLLALRDYQLGIGYWRLADLLQAEGGAPMAQALARCEEHLKSALSADARLAEAHAVHGLCASYRSELRKATGRPVKGQCSRSEAIERARELAPRNPRVLYVQAACAMHDGNLVDALELAQRAGTAFEHAPPVIAQHSDWGQAETCLLLAQLLLRQGNRAAARDRVEQALIAAPDYVAARELLAQIAATR